MKVTLLQASCVVVETNGIRILMDPWLTDGEYYGSWSQYPPFDMAAFDFNSVDYIYVSHIHPDHLSTATMKRLPQHIPVLIHSYRDKFLKRNIEALGFEVRELEHNRDVALKSGVSINILAADDCDPQLCGRFMGCAVADIGVVGSAQIDSMCVVTDGRSVLVNQNDCPYSLSSVLVPKILNHYGQVDILLHGYAGAGAFPQCFTNLSPDARTTAEAGKKRAFLEQGERYVVAFNPRLYLPFSSYTLSGRNASLDDRRGVADLSEAVEHFRGSEKIDHARSVCVPLNPGQSVTHDGVRCSAWQPIDAPARAAYRDTILAAMPYDYDGDDAPDQAELERLTIAAAQRMGRKAEQLNVKSDAILYYDIGNDYAAEVVMPTCETRVVRTSEISGQNYCRVTVEPKLLSRILRGPRFAHWNNAEIGSHIRFDRPRPYDRKLQFAMNFFHS